MDVTALMTRMIARTLISVRGAAVLPQAVYTDYSAMLAQNKGDTVNVPVPRPVGVIDITPGITAQVGDQASITPSTIPVTLDKWRGSKLITMTDFELSKIAATEDFIPSQLTQAGIEVVEDINASVFDKMRVESYNTIGTLGTAPFTTGGEAGVAPLTKAMVAADKAKMPTQNRNFVLDFDAKGNYMGVSQLTSAQEIGTNTTRLSGQFGTTGYGFRMLADGQVPTHTNGTATGMTTATLNPLGSSTVVLKIASGTQTLVPGTVFTFATHAQQYVVTGSTNYTIGTGGTSVSISPALTVAVDGTSTPVAITTVGAASASYKTNFVFDKNAVALVTRPIVTNDPTVLGLGLPQARKSVTMRDPVTNLVLRLQLFDQYNQYAWQLDTLYGSKIVRGEHVFKYVY